MLQILECGQCLPPGLVRRREVPGCTVGVAEVVGDLGMVEPVAGFRADESGLLEQCDRLPAVARTEAQHAEVLQGEGLAEPGPRLAVQGQGPFPVRQREPAAAQPGVELPDGIEGVALIGRLPAGPGQQPGLAAAGQCLGVVTLQAEHHGLLEKDATFAWLVTQAPAQI